MASSPANYSFGDPILADAKTPKPFSYSTMASSLPEPPPSPPSPQVGDSSDAERRLREAEDRLREAIEELQRRQRRAFACGPPHLPPCHHASDESCVAHAIGNLCQSFLLSYGVRVGIGILLRAFKLARRQSYSSLLDLKVLVSRISWNWGELNFWCLVFGFGGGGFELRSNSEERRQGWIFRVLELVTFCDCVNWSWFAIVCLVLRLVGPLLWKWKLSL